jgi:hypothetical protein
MSFFSLPLEILKYIFDKINIKQRAKCRLLCSYFKNALDRDCMWDDIKINSDMKLSSEECCEWLSHNTKVFDKIDKAKLLAINHKKQNSINIVWLITHYRSGCYFAELLWIDCIKHRSLWELKDVDYIIQSFYPDTIKRNIRYLCNIISNINDDVTFSDLDKKIGWIIKTYLDKNPLPEDFLRIYLYDHAGKLADRKCFNSAESLIKIGGTDSFYMRCDMIKNLDNKDITRKYIKLCRLYKSENDITLWDIITKKDQISLEWFWNETNILPIDRSLWKNNENVIRSAKIAHSMVMIAHEFSQVRWIVCNFEPVMRIVGADDNEVRKFMNCNLENYNTDVCREELVRRIPWYIRAGNAKKFEYVFRLVDNDDITDQRIKKWEIIADSYPSKEICRIINSKYMEIRKKLEKKRLKKIILFNEWKQISLEKEKIQKEKERLNILEKNLLGLSSNK